MFDKDFLSRAVSIGYTAHDYWMSRTLAEAFPDCAVLEVPAESLPYAAYAAAGHCRVAVSPAMHAETSTRWQGVDLPLLRHVVTGYCMVEWLTFDLHLIVSGDDIARRCGTKIWIVAESNAIAERFYDAVCRWWSEQNEELSDQLLVFDSGRWYKSAELFSAIKSATFENLILPGDLCSEIQRDLDVFLASKDLFARYGIPWKRGILLLGPPGNGKTHAVKALLNHLDQRCIYVKALQHYGDHHSIREIFERARKTTPCILVFEDLDSMIDSENRSFFLNEMDGFEVNTGVVVLATTNHPERLDPALLNRPSRFDRKYTFGLPEPLERRRYIAYWNAQVDPAMRIDEPTVDALVQNTSRFSYALLKELCVSAMVRWLVDAERTMGTVLEDQAGVLRAQIVEERCGGRRRKKLADD